MASSSVSAPAREAEVVVLYDPDPETVVRQLARGPIVVVGARPDAIRELGAGVTGRPFGIVSADVPRDTLDAVIAAVSAGLTVAPPEWLRPPLALPGGKSPRDPTPVEPLTPREREVLQQLAEGLHNRAIARALGISDHTVKFHLASIFGKLHVGTRTEAVRAGLRQGLVTI